MKQVGMKSLLLAIVAIVWLPNFARAQQFNYNELGDVLAGFRKSGVYAGSYQMVADLGNFTNFLNVPQGTTINITNFIPGQLTDSFTNYNNLQWSVFCSFPASLGFLPTPLGSFPPDTIWFTLPTTNVNTQTTAPARRSAASQSNASAPMFSVGEGAESISGSPGMSSNIDNNASVVREPIISSYSEDILSYFIADSLNPVLGDFGAGGSPMPYPVENCTTNPFVSAERCDFYQSCPATTSSRAIYTDPITGQTNGSAYFVGYFLLNPSGTMTFTRASAVSAPTIASVTSTATTGFSPLSVVFSDSSSGSITSWVWNFGNGTIITNTTSASVTNIYTSGGTYTVTLTVYGPGGSTSLALANSVVASPTPKISESFIANQFVLSGTNCPVGVQYRVLSSTNVALPLASWQPVFTNIFLANGNFSYTNASTNLARFFELVSP